MRILLAFLLVLGIATAYASEDTTNYGWTIPAIGDRDWQSTISEDMVSQDAIAKMVSNDVVLLNSGIAVDGSGIVSSDTQTFVNVYNSVKDEQLPLNAFTTLSFDAVVSDRGSDWSVDTFTAPSAGIYSISYMLRFNQIDSAATLYTIRLLASTTNFDNDLDPNFSADLDRITMSGNTIIGMAAAETVEVQFYQSGGTQQTDLNSSSYVQVLKVW